MLDRIVSSWHPREIPLQLMPGKHRVSFTRPDGHVSSSVIEIQPGRTAQLHD